MKFKLISVLTVIFLLVLPYYIFEGKMYLGGDDTRLFYSYPIDFLTNATFYSWYKVSSLGINGPSQYIMPFLIIWSAIHSFIPSVVSMNYLAFSVPFILGFIFFQKFVRELFNLKNNSAELYVGSLFYIFSPILIINQMFVFLISIWLIALIPIGVYYFLRYLKTSDFKYVFIASLWCLILSLAIYNIPWLTGFLLPIILGILIVSILFKKRQIFYFLKHLSIFFIFIFASQAFWLTGFISTYLNLGQDSFASKFLSQGFIDTFTPTVLSTATSSIFFPLLSLFHRQIAFDFVWKLKETFVNFYDSTFILNSLYVVVFAIGILFFRDKLKSQNRKIFTFLLISFIFSLYFFTVNIGPLKDLFLQFKSIPGFTMYRNFFDKFAPGYVIIYSTLITISLIIATSIFKKWKNLLLFAVFLVIIINFIPVKQTVNSPMWTTKDYYKTLIIPEEYIDFMNKINNSVSSSNNIFSVPFGSSVYSVIVDESDKNHIYAGVSPVKIFSGVNDISGHLSFNFTEIANTIDSHIVNRDYMKLNSIMYSHNINYILITRNVPSDLNDSYLFNPDLFEIQDEEFLDAITSEKVLTSENENYDLYRAKKINSLINSENVYFKKINQVKYRVYIKNINKKQDLSFLDSYHAGWNLYLQENPSLDFCQNPTLNIDTGTFECKQDSKLFEFEDLIYSFKNPIFNESQDIVYDYANKWTINPEYIKRNFYESYYKVNDDGGIDIELVLYFQPQNYFYLGTLITAIVFIAGGVYLFYEKTKKDKKSR